MERHENQINASPEGASKQRLTARVTGRVQGVGYRYFARSAAIATGVTGWVRNEYDRSVYVVAEGAPEKLAAFEARLRMGPPGGRVDALQTDIQPATGEFEDFRIR